MEGLAVSRLRIAGMHCAACAGTVEAALRRVRGVVEVRVSAAAQCAEVRWDPAVVAPRALERALSAAGYAGAADTAAAAAAMRRMESRAALWRLFVAGLCATQIMMLAEPAYLAAPGDIAPEYQRLLAWGAWVLVLPVMLFSAGPLFTGAWRSLRARRIGMDVPVALGLGIAFLASTAAAFSGTDPAAGRELWFDSISMFVTILLAARMLEMRARHRAERALEQAGARLPAQAVRVCADGSTRRVVLEDLVPGDRLRVALGEAFPADGRLVEGSTAADESLLTGESRPVAKAAGDPVVATSLNLGAPVDMVAERLGADTRAEHIAALMRAARTQRPALLAVADRWAAPFLWGVLALAACAYLGWRVRAPERALGAAIAVLIVTCPCALSLAAPAALLAAAGRMARQGLLVRDIDAIARLVRMRTLFIDKTGTLTTGQAQAGALHLLAATADGDAAALAGRAAALAAWSAHPLAQAIARRWPAGSTSWLGPQEIPGRGIQAHDDHGGLWQLGAPAWIGCAVPPGLEVVLACDGHALAGFTFAEALRDDAAQAVAALRADGVAVRLLSGDAPARVQAVAAALDLDDARGGLQPQDKLAAVAAAQAGGQCVAMIGDGVNDAPVLARADVAIAMGEGAAIARSQADAILLSNRLPDVVRARALARRSLRVVHQNLAWAAAYNATCVPLALTGHLPPWAAGAGMAASSLVVVLNSMRLAR